MGEKLVPPVLGILVVLLLAGLAALPAPPQADFCTKWKWNGENLGDIHSIRECCELASLANMTEYHVQGNRSSYHANYTLGSRIERSLGSAVYEGLGYSITFDPSDYYGFVDHDEGWAGQGITSFREILDICSDLGFELPPHTRCGDGQLDAWDSICDWSAAPDGCPEGTQCARNCLRCE